MVQRLVIAGAASGVGKTTIVAGLLGALKRRGRIVQPFKVGPDYIDPTFHTLVAGRACRNLDTWMMSAERVLALFHRASCDADVAVVEGVMGLFDGVSYDDEAGSTAEVAKLLHAPTVLVVDASKMARSAAALATGYARFDKDLHLAGFIVNRAGSARHGAGVAGAIEKATGLPVFGWLPREDGLRIAERHLGLVPTSESGGWEDFVKAAADAVSRHVDVDRLLGLAGGAPPHSSPSPPEGVRGCHGLSPRRGGKPVIAVARDEAFHFTYEETLELLQAAGARVVFFSPLTDSSLPPDTSGIILSGGFPEMFAGRLAANQSMKDAIREAHGRDLPIYAECGGLMYLTEAIIDLENEEHVMVGLLPGRSTMSGKVTLGYRRARAAQTSWLMEGGEAIRGHEFHYSAWKGRPADLAPAYWLTAANGEGQPWPEGASLGSLWASYVHVHFWGKAELATRFVAACRAPVGLAE